MRLLLQIVVELYTCWQFVELYTCGFGGMWQFVELSSFFFFKLHHACIVSLVVG